MVNNQLLIVTMNDVLIMINSNTVDSNCKPIRIICLIVIVKVILTVAS